MNITIASADGENFAVVQVSQLKDIIKGRWNIPNNQQTLYYNGKVLNDQQLLSQAGVGAEDMITVQRTRAAPPPVSTPATTTNRNQDISELASSIISRLAATPKKRSAPPAQVLTEFIKKYCNVKATEAEWKEMTANFLKDVATRSDLLATINQINPQVADAIKNNNSQVVTYFLQNIAHQLDVARIRHLAEIDPTNEEAQKFIEEEIASKAIEEQRLHAMEHNPESFASVVMLYCAGTVNNHSVTALIDSGAQMTIMSAKCAEKCGLLRFVDKRHASIARGVGESKILGKVHSALLKIGNTFLDISLSIIEQNTIEFIFGLDMMKKHRCIIDLIQDKLIIGNDQVPFLTEGEIPMRYRGQNALKTTEEIAKDEFMETSSSTASSTTVSSTPPNSSSAAPNTTPTQASVLQPTPPPASSTMQVDPPSTQASSNDNESKIAHLMTLGFPRQLCQSALEMANGDVETAANILFTMSS